MDSLEPTQPLNNSFWNDTGKTGITSWIFSTDHKRIGLLYFYVTFGFFLTGVLLGLLLRIELMAPILILHCIPFDS